MKPCLLLVFLLLGGCAMDNDYYLNDYQNGGTLTPYYPERSYYRDSDRERHRRHHKHRHHRHERMLTPVPQQHGQLNSGSLEAARLERHHRHHRHERHNKHEKMLAPVSQQHGQLYTDDNNIHGNSGSLEAGKLEGHLDARR